jgi:hypothetical protein
MKVKISDRESEAKMARWMNGEIGVFSKERVNCEVNDVDDCLLRKRGIVYNEIALWDDEDISDFDLLWAIVCR